ncbi:MAG: PAS domain-containing protein [Candidatus Syntrophosphaera sp.]|nr:PAS domain-containing protein [Candidatus Syntrophosphaera sp.]
MHEWIKHFPVAITVCDQDGTIIEMNDAACATFSDHGGAALIGTSLYDCHQPRSIAIIKDMLATGKNNVYSIEKNGVRKLIYQQPWQKDGEQGGLVEISFVLPPDMEHHVRS